MMANQDKFWPSSSGPGQSVGEDEPFGLDGGCGGWGGAAGAGIPVAGVAVIAFLAVEMGMDPSAIGIGDILTEAVGLVPASGAGEPEGLGGGGESRRGSGVVGGGLGEVLGGHWGRNIPGKWH